MHGLIFETSIWLLAGSTRLIHHSWLASLRRGEARSLFLPSQSKAAVRCHKSRWLCGNTPQVTNHMKCFKTPTHMPKEDRHTVKTLNVQCSTPSRSQAKSKWQMLLDQFSIAPEAGVLQHLKDAVMSRPQLSTSRLPSCEEKPLAQTRILPM